MNRGALANILFIASLFSLIFVVACKPSHTSLVTEKEELVGPPTAPEKPVDDNDGDQPTVEKIRTLPELLAQPEFIDFSHIQKFVTKNHCMECHDSSTRKDGVDVSTYDSVMMGNSKKLVYRYEPNRSSLYSTLLVAKEASRHMPPKRKTQLSQQQIDLIYHWISKGAQEVAPKPVTTDDSDGTTTPPVPTPTPIPRAPSIKEILDPYYQKPETIDFAVINKHIVQPLCAKCHSDASTHHSKKDAQYSLNTTHYEDFFDPEAPTIRIGIPARSKMFKSIAVNQIMPPPKEGYDLVDPYTIKLLRLWILNCAIEDYSKMKGETLLKDPINEKLRLCEGQ